MPLEKTRRKKGGCLIAELARSVSQTNLAVAVSLALPHRSRARRISRGGIGLRTDQLLLRPATRHQEIKRRCRTLAVADTRNEPRPFGIDLGPIADMHLAGETGAFDVFQVRIQRECILIGR